MGMPLEKQIKLLTGVDVLEPLSEEELAELGRRNPDIRLQAGEVFSTPGEHDEKFFILKEGRVRIYRQDPEGHQQTLAQIGDGTPVSGQRLQGSYAEAVEPSVLMSLRFEDIRRLNESNPEVGMRLIQLLGERLSRCDEKLTNVTLKEVPARLANLILDLIEDEGVVTPEGFRIPAYYTHEQLGMMIGARRVAVSRAFSKLREAGAIETKRRRIHVKDKEALQHIAREERGRGGRTSASQRAL